MNNQNTDLISVIIPVYNVEDYLHQCIKSVINQTYKNLEIILVDDGSTDLSGSICDEYADIDSRIRVLHEVNQGVSVSRNLGLSVAKGEYIAFLDSDDWVATDMYEKLHETIVTTQTDVAFGITERQSNKSYNHIPDGKLHVLSGSDILDAFVYPNHPCHIQKAIWDKLYSRGAIGDNKFYGKQGEDGLFNLKVLSDCSKVSFIAFTMCFYRDDRNGNATSTRLGKRFLSDTIPIAKKCIEILNEKNRKDLAFRQTYYLYQDMFLIYKKMRRNSIPEEREVCKEILKILKDDKLVLLKCLFYKNASWGYRIKTVVFVLLGVIL